MGRPRRTPGRSYCVRLSERTFSLWPPITMHNCICMVYYLFELCTCVFACLPSAACVVCFRVQIELTIGIAWWVCTGTQNNIVIYPTPMVDWRRAACGRCLEDESRRSSSTVRSHLGVGRRSDHNAISIDRQVALRDIDECWTTASYG